MITRRDFIKCTGVGLGAVALPFWLTLPEPATDIQKYFTILECDGRKVYRAPNYDAYEITSYIWCSNGKKPDISSHKGREGLRYFYRNTTILGTFLAATGSYPKSKEEAEKFLAVFHKDIKETRNELEVLIKKELGNRNIWVYSSLYNEGPSQTNWPRIVPEIDKVGPRYELKLLKRI